MTRKSLFVLGLCCMAFAAVSGQQRTLQYQDRTGGIEVFAGKESEAGVVVVCMAAIPLTFTSSKDKTVDLYKTETLGSDKYYYFRFPTGRSYEGRKLTAYASMYASLEIPLELERKTVRRIYVFDPDAILLGCYVQTMKEAFDIFRWGQYKEAQEKYKLAMNCSDAPTDVETLRDLTQRISDIDTLLRYRDLANRYYETNNFRKAADHYMQAYMYNPGDGYLSTRRVETDMKLAQTCKADFETAERYRRWGKLEKAIGLYENVVAQACSNTAQARTGLQLAERRLDRRHQRSRVRTYEYAAGVPIGVSLGGYWNEKSGGYFTLRTSGTFFNALRLNNKAGDQPEANMSFGWTRRLYSPLPDDAKWPLGLWLHIGLGATLKGRYTPPEDPASKTTLKDYGLGYAASPEAGTLIKAGPVALRYTFQYRFWLTKESADVWKAMQHVWGVGVCF